MPSTRNTAAKSAPKGTGTKRTTTTAKKTPAQAPAAKATPKADALKKDAAKEQGGMTAAQKKKIAAEIIKLRSQTPPLKWDGEGGVCEKVGIKTALVGRALMREYGAGDQIKPLTGSRAA